MLVARHVEVNYVRAKVVGSGICTKNGIIHKVDHILGISGRTIYKEIEANPTLGQVAERRNRLFVLKVTREKTRCSYIAVSM